MHLEESQFILFDLQQSVEEVAKSSYAVGKGSFIVNPIRPRVFDALGSLGGADSAPP